MLHLWRRGAKSRGTACLAKRESGTLGEIQTQGSQTGTSGWLSTIESYERWSRLDSCGRNYLALVGPGQGPRYDVAGEQTDPYCPMVRQAPLRLVIIRT